MIHDANNTPSEIGGLGSNFNDVVLHAADFRAHCGSLRLYEFNSTFRIEGIDRK